VIQGKSPSVHVKQVLHRKVTTNTVHDLRSIAGKEESTKMKVTKLTEEVNRLKKIAGLLREDIDLTDTPEFSRELDLKKVSNIEFDGIDPSDYPDFVDAHIISADYNGRPMTDDEIEELNQHSDFVYDALMDYLY
jgi:hypothetical protein